MHRLTRQVVAKQLNKPVVRQGILQRSITTAFRLAPPRVSAKPLLAHSRYLSTHPAFNRRMATLAANDYKDIAFLKWNLFPNFEYLLTQTEPAVAVPIFKKLLDAAQQQFLAMKFEPTYEGTIGQLTELEDEISRAFGILSHFNGVKNSPGVRSTLEQIQPEFIKLSLLMNQSVPKYEALEQLKNSSHWDTLDAVQQRIVDHELRSMKHAGIGFKDPAQKKRFNEISERLSQLSLTFGNNVLDATKAFKYVVKDKAELEGVSDAFLKTLENNAKNNGIEDGGYCITLDYPIYGPFMMNCKNRELREKIYRANITKASEGKVNNEPIINEILSLKHEKANLLGYKTHADLSLAVKMAQTLPAAETLLDDLFTASLPHAKEELKELGRFASDKLNQPSPLQPWDVGYVTEQYRKELFKYDEETIANYFSFPKVMDGLFEVADKILGIQVQELTPEERQEKGITTWHPDVKVFQVSEKGNVKAYFYGDFYSRPAEKRSGAWMDIVTSRYKDAQGNIHLPVSYLICNQPPPQSDDMPSLMKFRDVETLFHEFGHCLQHMMTTVDYAPASGVNGIEWDFVEVASQFMENFCNEPEWIDKLSGHYKTHEKMPKDMVDALVKSKKFMAGLATLRQLHFAKTDLALHSSYLPKEGGPSVFDVEAGIAKDTVLTPRLPEDRFLCSFNHIFGGGYSAGYYSYKWSETYSADAYAAFEEEKEANGQQGIVSMGQRYRDTVLALGGGTPPQQVWKEFRGRDNVDVKALLRHTGLN